MPSTKKDNAKKDVEMKSKSAAAAAASADDATTTTTRKKPVADYDEEPVVVVTKSAAPAGEVEVEGSDEKAAAAPAAAAKAKSSASEAVVEVGAAAGGGDAEKKKTKKNEEEEKKKLPPGDTRDYMEMTKHLLFSSKINILLIAVPLCFPQITGDGAVNFVVSFLALVPLAALLSDLTEDIALRSNETTAALLNVSMGNATELIVSIAALLQGQLDIIKYSLIGSVLGNSLLVLGSALVIGGFKRKLLTFNSVAAKTYGTATILAIFAYAIASTLASVEPIDDTKIDRDRAVLNVSRWCSAVLCIVYSVYVYFSQASHKHLFEGGASVEDELEHTGREVNEHTGEGEEKKNEGKEKTDEENKDGEKKECESDDDDDDDDDEEPQFSLVFAIAATAVTTIFISFASEFLVGSLEPATKALGLTRLFIGVCIIPIAANVAEHGTALIVAAHGKMDLAVGVAAGSSVQIAMFVLPLMVLVGYAADVPLDLTLEPFLLAMMALSAILVFFITSSGTATWLGGAKLLCAYFIVAVALFNAHDPKTRDTPLLAEPTTTAAATTTMIR